MNKNVEGNVGKKIEVRESAEAEMLRRIEQGTVFRAEPMAVHNDETGRVETRAVAVQVRDLPAKEEAGPEPAHEIDLRLVQMQADHEAREARHAARETSRRENIPRVIHLLRRAAVALPTHDPLVTTIRQQIEALLPMGHMGVGTREDWGSLQTIADALALDPHSEAATRDVRAALELLS